MNRIFKYALMFAFVGIAIFALSQMSDGAEGASCTWKQTSGNLASTAANWENGSAPVAGDTVYFTSLSTASCTWDVTANVSKVATRTGYSGTITLSSTMNVGTGGIDWRAGTFRGNSQWIESDGDVMYYAGDWGSLSINMTVDGTTLKTWSTVCMTNFRFFADVTLTSDGSRPEVQKMRIGQGCILTIPTGQTARVRMWSGTTYDFNNYGTVTGAGTLELTAYNANKNVNLGDVDCDVTFRGDSGMTSSYTFTLISDVSTKGLLVVSDHASNTMALNMAGFDIEAATINNSTRGIIYTSTGKITLTGGTSYIDDVHVNDLTISGSVVFNGNVNVWGTLVCNGQWTGRIYYNGTADISTDKQHWTGWLYTQNDIAIEYNAYAYLAFNHDTWLGIQMNSWSGTDNFTWNATSVASQTVQWSWSRGESSAMYDEYQDTIYIGSSETNAGGMGTFTSTFVGSHAFFLSRSTFLPASTDIDDSVWLGILFMCIATIINFVGYVRKIGLLQIVSFLVLLVGIFAATDVWEELWTLPTLFILTNAVIFIIGMMRRR